MAKRKKSSRKPVAKRKNEPLPSTFSCLFCNHEQSVSVKLDRKLFIGQLECRICGQDFQCSINHLSAAVDVYSEWVDAADAVAAGDSKEANGTVEPPVSRFKPAASMRDKADASARYNGEATLLADNEI